MIAESEIDEWDATMQGRLNSQGHRNGLLGLRIAGILTILGAGYIIQDIAKDAARRKTTKNRIILFMSCCDFLNGFFQSVIGAAMVPKEIDIPGAVGNQLTCDIQGFLVYATVFASGLYNCSLALCYLLIVCYEYPDERLRVLEPYFLYTPIMSCLVVAIAGLPFGIYNFNGTYICSVHASPLDCDVPESAVECERGGKYIYWFYTSGIMIIISACFIIVCMVKMYKAVLQRERSGDRFRFSRSSFIISRAAPPPISSPSTAVTQRRSSSIRHRDLSRTMRSQGLWYSGAFLFTFFPVGLLFFLWQVEIRIYYFPLLAARLIGFTNAVIYVRPKFLKFRRAHPNMSVVSSIWYTLTRKRPVATTRISSERRDLSVPASIQQKNVMNSGRQDVQVLNTGSESSLIITPEYCSKKNELPGD